VWPLESKTREHLNTVSWVVTSAPSPGSEMSEEGIAGTSPALQEMLVIGGGAECVLAGERDPANG
jgi:hypothetical protein